MTLTIAIIGLVLSLINTFTAIYREFLKKAPSPYLDVYCDYAYWRYAGDNKTECQIILDLTVVPRIQANSIKKIVFINKEHNEVFGSWGNERNHATFYKLVENIYGENIFSKYHFDELKDFITETNKTNQKDVRNINLPVDFAYSFSLCEKFDGFRYPDGYEDIPSSGWFIQIFDSYNKYYEKPIEFNFIK